jgi:hypothetical protein
MKQAIRLTRYLLGTLLLAGLVACGGEGGNSSSATPQAVESATLETLSSKPDVVSGGDSLVRVKLFPATATVADIALTAGNTDITSSLKPTGDGSLLAHVTGLPDGSSTLSVKRKATGDTLSALTLTNHSITGPVFAGPHPEIFGCETTAWNLGPATGVDCTAEKQVTYQYKAQDGTFKPYPSTGPAPTDIAAATLAGGKKVDYVIRLETGVIDRAVYQIAFLNKPGEGVPTPMTAPAYAGWNQRLVYTFGGGCGGGHHQGATNGGVVNDLFLSQGYAVASSSQNVLAVQCSDVRSAEAASMVKEYFIKNFGLPAFTIGFGGSGGAMQQHLIATNYPGILDGILPSAGSFRDTITEVNSTLDCSLMKSYFARGATQGWTDAQKQSVVGWASWSACDIGGGDIDTGANGLGRIMVNPKGCDAIGSGSVGAVPSVYDPVTNPNGARCTYQDVLVNVFGKDDRGFARRPFDNVGVQYGLSALKGGSISFDQFIELNQKVGGYDIDGNIITSRTLGNPDAVAIAYKSGRVTDGVELGNIPIIDYHAYTDLLPGFGGMHDLLQAYMMRARLVRSNGDAQNQVILVPGLSSAGTAASFSLAQMDRWLTAINADKSTATAAAKVRANRPADLKDACWDAAGNMIDQASADGTTGSCATMNPLHSDPRIVSGAPITNDVLKCTLKAVDANEYGMPLTGTQVALLQSTFPAGVCDYSKPGQGQAKVATTWAKY